MVPSALIRQIGPASSVGRPKWEKLGSLIAGGKLSDEQAISVESVVRSSTWQSSNSDQRFALVLAALDHVLKREPDVTEVSVAGGTTIVAKRSGVTTQIAIPDNRLPGLSAWLLQRLPELVEEFRSIQKEENVMR